MFNELEGFFSPKKISSNSSLNNKLKNSGNGVGGGGDYYNGSGKENLEDDNQNDYQDRHAATTPSQKHKSGSRDYYGRYKALEVITTRHSSIDSSCSHRHIIIYKIATNH